MVVSDDYVDQFQYHVIGNPVHWRSLGFSCDLAVYLGIFWREGRGRLPFLVCHLSELFFFAGGRG